MNLLSKISLLLITAGWLAGFQSGVQPGDILPPAFDTDQHGARISGDANSEHLQPSPFLPAALAETEQRVSEEIEPGSGSPIVRPSDILPLRLGADYLQICGQNESFHPALTLLYPFHTYL